MQGTLLSARLVVRGDQAWLVAGPVPLGGLDAAAAALR
jgi:hypothetical protein